MSPRVHLIRDVLGIAAAVLVSLVWIHSQHPTQTLEPAVDSSAQPPRATCESVPVDRGQLHIDSGLAVECPDQIAGRNVSYVGEIVGDVIQRSGGSWVQLNDDPYALTLGPLPLTGEQGGTNSGLAVWLPSPLDQDLLAGRARQRGSVLAVTGAFHRADPQDGGGTTIRADHVEVLAPGAAIAVTVRPGAVAAAVGLLALAAVQWQRLRRSPRHARRSS